MSAQLFWVLEANRLQSNVTSLIIKLTLRASAMEHCPCQHSLVQIERDEYVMLFSNACV